MSNVLITGVNGFIGSHVARKFLSEKHNIRGLVRKTSDLSLINDLDIELLTGDICDISSLEPAVKNIDLLVHIAGFASDWGKYNDFYKSNILGTQNIVSVANNAGVKRMVHISTVAVHGFGFRNFSENSPFSDRLNNYAKTKKLAEEWLFNSIEDISMEITCIRPGNVFGPDDHTFMDKYLKSVETGRLAQINHGRSYTCPCYVENLADAIYLAGFSKNAVGEAFIITDGLNISWNEFNDLLASELGTKMSSISVPFVIAYIIAFLMEIFYKLLFIRRAPFLTRYRISNGGKDYHFSIEKAKSLLNWEPKVNLSESVKRTVEWFQRI